MFHLLPLSSHPKAELSIWTHFRNSKQTLRLFFLQLNSSRKLVLLLVPQSKCPCPLWFLVHAQDSSQLRMLQGFKQMNENSLVLAFSMVILGGSWVPWHLRMHFSGPPNFCSTSCHEVVRCPPQSLVSWKHSLLCWLTAHFSAGRNCTSRIGKHLLGISFNSSKHLDVTGMC